MRDRLATVLAAGLVIVNLLGGIVASISFTILQLWPELFWMFLIVLTVGLAAMLMQERQIREASQERMIAVAQSVAQL